MPNGIMFQLYHSSNHETSSFVKDMLPVVVNKVGTSPPFSMPFAISNYVESNRESNRRGGSHSLVRVANSSSDKIMEHSEHCPYQLLECMSPKLNWSQKV